MSDKEIDKLNSDSDSQTSLKQHITLEERLKNFNGKYSFQESDWGKPEGSEL